MALAQMAKEFLETESMTMADVAIVGSGLSGSLAAKELVDAGARVIMLDIGHDDPHLRELIPDEPYSVLRSEDAQQSKYFLGDTASGLPKRGVRVGAQLTPPRQFIHEKSDQLLPFESEEFHPLQPVSVGGLGAGWGAACFTFDAGELQKMGIADENVTSCYQRAAQIIGVSADRDSELNERLWCGVPDVQPPLAVDTNGQTLLSTYSMKRRSLISQGFHLGRIPMAILTQDIPPRRANPYFDMDFYSDVRMSIFRPRYLLESLREKSCFDYRSKRVVIRFEDCKEFVRVDSLVHGTDDVESVFARRIVICAGALNTARIALNSLGLTNVNTTLLCNPYTYVPTVNVRMLGRRAENSRHSMAQIGGFLRADRDGSEIAGVFQMYSYRSLLLFKLVKEMPLPPRLGLQIARVLMNSLAIFGIFFADRQSASKFLNIRKVDDRRCPTLFAGYKLSEAEMLEKRRHEKRFLSSLMKLGCIPIGKLNPGNAGSIHYAGTIPFSNPLTPHFRTNPDGTLEGAPNVYVGDGASWNYLPAKGLSFTLMANGIRIARRVLRSL